MTPTNNKASPAVNASEVENYLIANPKFFLGRSALLAELVLPHESGPAVSLVERQVSILRDRSVDQRKRMGQLLDTARDNDRLFHKSQALILALLEASSLDELVTTLQSHLRDDYQVDSNALILFGTPDRFPAINAPVVTLDEARKQLAVIIDNLKPTCGTLRENEMAFLFRDSPRSVGSVAVAPIHRCTGERDCLGLLAVGSVDPDYYRPDTGTLFLTYIAEVLARLLPRFLPGTGTTHP